MLLILIAWTNDVSCILQVIINALSRHCNHTFVRGEQSVEELYSTDIHS